MHRRFQHWMALKTAFLTASWAYAAMKGVSSIATFSSGALAWHGVVDKGRDYTLLPVRRAMPVPDSAAIAVRSPSSGCTSAQDIAVELPSPETRACPEVPAVVGRLKLYVPAGACG
jgi:hypothetical protein